jgi:hypothetical protein
LGSDFGPLEAGDLLLGIGLGDGFGGAPTDFAPNASVFSPALSSRPSTISRRDGAAAFEPARPRALDTVWRV